MPNYCTPFDENTFTPATIGLTDRVFYPCAGVGVILLSQLQAVPAITIIWTAPTSPFIILRYNLYTQKNDNETVITYDVTNGDLDSRQYVETDMSALAYHYTIEVIYSNGLSVISNTLFIKNEPERPGEIFAPSDKDVMTTSEDETIYVEKE